MKRKLLFATMSLIAGAWSLSANAQQQDVTATYLTNADFSSGTVIDNGICTYGKDMAGNNTTYYGAQAIDGWTNASVGVEADGYAGCAIAGGLFAVKKIGYVYAGAGYGIRNLVWYTESGQSVAMTPGTYKGVALEAGMVFNIGHVLVSAGGLTQFPGPYFEMKAGVGYKF